MGVHPALWLLARRKLRGTLRKQWRRMRTFKGAAFTLLGLGIFSLWIGSLVLQALVGTPVRHDPERLRAVAGVAALFVTVLSFSGSLIHRGLYLPREEIERLFSAPVSRADLVRYRLIINIGRSLLGSLFLWILTLRHLPHGLYSFLGVLALTQTLPVINQLLAIVVAGLAGGGSRRGRRWLQALLVLLVVVSVPFIYLFVVRGTGLPKLPALSRLMQGMSPASLVNNPWVETLTLPFVPWVRAITASNAAEFWPWFLLATGLWWLLFELTARLPVDFREVSIETSQRVARRLRRRSRGGAAGSRASRRIASWGLPWLFGRGPGGAIAWMKLASIVRRAKGTLAVSTLVLLFVTALSFFAIPGEDSALIGAGLIAGLGTVYLCAGLRFDFRDELDRMEVIRSWPLSPRRIFAAMLLPEASLVSVLIILAMLLRVALSGTFPIEILGFALVVPPAVMGWIALDNLVFLISPVRFVPGQEGALQNAGRGMILVFVRMLLAFFVFALGIVPAVGLGFLVHEYLGWPLLAAEGIGLVCLLILFAGLLWALTSLGGVMLRRFDVARDRG